MSGRRDFSSSPDFENGVGAGPAFVSIFAGGSHATDNAKKYARQFALREETRLAREQGIGKGKKLFFELRTNILAEIDAIICCTVCRATIRREPKTNVSAWGKKRRCDQCRERNKSATGIKYCRHCGCSMHRADHPDPKSWATVACCEKCKTFMKMIEEELLRIIKGKDRAVSVR